MRKILLSITFTVLCFVVYSQENEGIPPSPTVASLVTIEKDSVNSSGMIAQNVPLWNIKVGKYEFPIQLFYSSSGVKVEEMSSYVGTGWNLSAGGVITRSVVDLPDDMISSLHGRGILHNNLLKDIKSLESSITTNGYNENTSKDFIKNKVNENLQDRTRNDTQPDIFYFNFFGIQGKFLFNEDKEIVSISNDNFKFSYELASDNTLSSFTITDTKGIVYTFSIREYSKTEYTGGSAFEGFNRRSRDRKKMDYYSSWHLTSILTPDNRTITFDYDDESTKYELRDVVAGKICGTKQCDDTNLSTQEIAKRDVDNNIQGAVTKFEVSSKKIKTISSEDLFTIDFTNVARQDLEGGLKLYRISVKNMYGEEVENYQFNHSYFNSPGMPTTDQYEYKRLKLNDIRRKGRFFQQFTYYEDYPLPHKKSTEQDYWGYYNKNGATSLVPKVYVEDETIIVGKQEHKYHIFSPKDVAANKIETYGSIERNVNSSYIHMGMLKKIDYQTGGSKTFYYEPNDFTHKEYTSGDTAIKGNGVRVQKIEYSDGNKIETLNYSYKKPDTNVSSGRLSYLPQFAVHIPWYVRYDIINHDLITITSPSYSNYVRQEIRMEEIKWTDSNGNEFVRYERRYCFAGGGNNLEFSPTNKRNEYFAMTTKRYSKSQLPLSLNVEHPIAYSHITLDEGENGKKEFHFDVLGAIDEESLPTGFDHKKFRHRSAFSTFNWYLADRTQLQQGPCMFGTLLPIGSATLNGVTKHYNLVDLTGYSHPFAPKPNWNRYFGSLKDYTYFNEEGDRVFKESYEYETTGDISNSSSSKKVLSIKYNSFSRPIGYGWAFSNPYQTSIGPTTAPTLWVWSFIDTYYGIGLVPTKTTREFYHDGFLKQISTQKENKYSHGNLLTEEKTKDSKGDTYKTIYKYPMAFEINNNSYKKMLDRNIIMPLEIVSVKGDNQFLGADLTEYVVSSSEFLTKSKYKLERKEHSYNYDLDRAPVNGSTINKDLDMIQQIEYIRYDTKGNLLEYKNKVGEKTVLIWGYKKQYPIAVIKGSDISYESIERDLIQNTSIDVSIQKLKELSNSNNEELLLDRLNKAREFLKDYFMTTYTYKPLVGVTSITNPRGETSFYKYDHFNRLKLILDSRGNVLSENKYNYKRY
ncbi:hypothetical protein [Tenacibaculum agarivorans]|uniref:hypothetical protein n=1 Tax=Tenacibaculum agarivorans TaxID=1908389 RepID=UPI00094BC5C2|nr:hypothetical protein [Tenacibaculum agarivorans]